MLLSIVGNTSWEFITIFNHEFDVTSWIYYVYVCVAMFLARQNFGRHRIRVCFPDFWAKLVSKIKCKFRRRQVTRDLWRHTCLWRHNGSAFLRFTLISDVSRCHVLEFIVERAVSAKKSKWFRNFVDKIARTSILCQRRRLSDPGFESITSATS